MKRYAVIVAAGTGSRMNAGLPKQFLELKGKPVLFYSLSAFYKHDPAIELIIVLAESEIDRWKNLCIKYEITIPHSIISGGNTRTESVRNGLHLLDHGLVAIHDGARPLVSDKLISGCYESAKAQGSGVACVQPKDSIRFVGNNMNNAVDRNDYRLMQTPQTFDIEKLKRAFDLCGTEASTDDASIFEKAGYSLFLVQGDYKNLKITTPEDLLLAESLLNYSNV